MKAVREVGSSPGTGRPLLLDLFCGAGGAAVGYHRAGFNVVGVDIKRQPRYPFEFHQAGALAVLALIAAGDPAMPKPDAIHASPPCQDHTRQYVPRSHGTGHLLAETRDALMRLGRPWVIENVPGAPMRVDLKLCGCMFGLPDLERERWFETSWHAMEMRSPCYHNRPVISVSGTGTPTGTWKVYGSVPLSRMQECLGIDWMTRAELSQAIPPAYTEHIGKQLMEQLVSLTVPGPTWEIPEKVSTST